MRRKTTFKVKKRHTRRNGGALSPLSPTGITTRKKVKSKRRMKDESLLRSILRKKVGRESITRERAREKERALEAAAEEEEIPEHIRRFLQSHDEKKKSKNKIK